MNIRKIVLLVVFVAVALVLLVTLVTPSLSTPAAVSQGGLLSAINTEARQTSASSSSDTLYAVAARIEEQRIVLKDASLQIVVENVATTLETITKLAEEMGGWVINSSTTKSAYTSVPDMMTGSIAIRVPAVQFTNAISQIKSAIS